MREDLNHSNSLNWSGYLERLDATNAHIDADVLTCKVHHASIGLNSKGIPALLSKPACQKSRGSSHVY